MSEPVERTDIISTVLCAVFCKWLCPMMNYAFDSPEMSEVAGWFHYHVCEPILLWHEGYISSPWRKDRPENPRTIA